MLRPVNDSQVWLKNVHSPSVPAIHNSTGEASAMLRKRFSISPIACATRWCEVTSRITAATPSRSPSSPRKGKYCPSKKRDSGPSAPEPGAPRELDEWPSSACRSGAIGMNGKAASALAPIQRRASSSDASPKPARRRAARLA